MNEQISKLAYSVDEAALLANVGRDKIYDALRTHRLKAKKDGRRTLILADDLSRYLSELPDLQFGAGDAA